VGGQVSNILSVQPVRAVPPDNMMGTRRTATRSCSDARIEPLVLSDLPGDDF
jgi:hypothetical protein